ncbi:DeoR/GlpR family DNA-binding transcription regulator [Streptomyces sp. DSM 41014]|uniref:DeoR/GlpR family DNA-binding transcription regulator n=2 Tax=Streptomyces hintoniae TaxID=3075521 RepID=A0ABU2UKR9_9ACTN|nr:DeoR/GlpR family DNA-binding transcription regulator [Streptomyces sp. DSM 41014]
MSLGVTGAIDEDGRRMLRTERHSRIVEHVVAQGGANVVELSNLLHVSPATVRRDLQYLDDQRVLRRTHGGAVAGEEYDETPPVRRAGRARAQKRAIAEAAVELIPRGAVVGLTGGTTTAEVARLLAERGPLTIVTNALDIAAQLVPHTEVSLVVVGGHARSRTWELVGPAAEKALAEYHTDVTVLGVDGVSAAHGCTTHDQLEASTNRAFVTSGETVLVVADGSKVGRATFARICPAGDVDHLITDEGARGGGLDAIAAAGVHVTTVPVP